ncbi:MAG: hypothetical protein LBI58_02100, partial [Tannerellaceae bacterium]|nr:hypothetical protein [Tannerellaceae bacterium]
SNRTVYPSRNLELRLHYKNIREATVRIYKSARKIEDTLGCGGFDGVGGGLVCIGISLAGIVRRRGAKR